MARLTITLDEDLLERSRAKAQEEGTSVDALLRSCLEAYSSSHEEREQAVKELLELSRKATSGSGGRRWTREELHEPDALAETEQPSVPTSREPFAALRALSGTAHSKLPALLDKIASGFRDAPALSNEAVSRAGIYAEDLDVLDPARSRRVEQEVLDLLDKDEHHPVKNRDEAPRSFLNPAKAAATPRSCRPCLDA